MQELSLNILDVAQNSVSADATLITIDIVCSTVNDALSITICDNGFGMDADQVARVTDPFYTTRTTRKVGLGIPFFKMAAEMTGGEFSIQSTPGVGTTTTAHFVLSHIDRMPLGDIAGTFTALVGSNPQLDFMLTCQKDEKSFAADTRAFREILREVPLSAPEVLSFIDEYIRENLILIGSLG
ncbi:MAG: ATP-binding protein [Oscillospiraceae bacterium]